MQVHTALLMLVQIILLLVIPNKKVDRTSIYLDTGTIGVPLPHLIVSDLFGYDNIQTGPITLPVQLPYLNLDCDDAFYGGTGNCYSPIKDELPNTFLHMFRVAEPHGIYTMDASVAPVSSPVCLPFHQRGSEYIPLNNISGWCNTDKDFIRYIVFPPPPMPIQLEHTIVYMGGASTYGSRVGTSLLYTYPSNRLLSSPLVGLLSFGLTVLNNEIYIAGGNQPRFTSNQFMKYVPLTDVWVKLHNIPFPRIGCFLTTHNDKIYIAGGDNGLKSTNITDISVFSNNSWFTWGTIPSTCINIVGIASFQSNLYIVAVCNNRTLIIIFRWETQWEQIGILSYVEYSTTLSERLYTVVIGDSLYIFYQAPNHVILKRYNGSALIDVGNFTTPSIQAASYAILDSTIYFLGGVNYSTSVSSTARVISYDTINNGWNISLPPLLFPLSHFGAAAVMLPTPPPPPPPTPTPSAYCHMRVPSTCTNTPCRSNSDCDTSEDNFFCDSNCLPPPPPPPTPNCTGNMYVAVYDGQIAVIDVTTKSVLYIFQVDGIDDIVALAVSHDGKFAYAADDSDPANVYVIDLVNRTIIYTFQFSGSVSAFAVSPNDRTVLITIITTTQDPSAPLIGFISVINTTNHSISAFSFNNPPTGVVISPDGETAFMIAFDGQDILAFDITTGTELYTIHLNNIVTAYIPLLAISPDGKLLYVVINVIIVVNITAKTPIYTMDVMDNASANGVSVSHDGKILYFSANTDIFVVDLYNRTLLYSFPVAFTPTGIALFPCPALPPF